MTETAMLSFYKLVSFSFIIISSVVTFYKPNMIFVTISFVIIFMFQDFFIIRNESSKDVNKIKIADFDDEIKILSNISDSLEERIEAIEKEFEKINKERDEVKKELLMLKTLNNNRESFGSSAL